MNYELRIRGICVGLSRPRITIPVNKFCCDSRKHIVIEQTYFWTRQTNLSKRTLRETLTEVEE